MKTKSRPPEAGKEAISWCSINGCAVTVFTPVAFRPHLESCVSDRYRLVSLCGSQLASQLLRQLLHGHAPRVTTLVDFFPFFSGEQEIDSSIGSNAAPATSCYGRWRGRIIRARFNGYTAGRYFSLETLGHGAACGSHREVGPLEERGQSRARQPSARNIGAILACARGPTMATINPRPA